MANSSANVERLELTRAWIAVATGHQLHVTTEHINSLFWEQVKTEYTTNSSTTKNAFNAFELQSEWKRMCPGMVAFVALFSQRWRHCQHLSKKGEECLVDAFDWAMKRFQVSTKRDFEYQKETWVLITHAKWWSVLKPQIMQQFALMHDDELEMEEVTQAEDLMEFPVAPEDEPEFPESPMCGVTRPRSEDEEQEDDRRVRQKLDSEDLHSLASMEGIPPSRSNLESISSNKSQDAPKLEDEPTKKPEMASVMERRLELDIMTQSEEGLSIEAKEYLRLQRQLILRKLKQTTHLIQ